VNKNNKNKSKIKELKFDRKGLIPVITADEKTNEVLMLAYMNKEALKKTLQEKRVWYFSRSRKKLWLKGETSGNFQYLKSIFFDCDADALLVKVLQTNVACHTGNRSCFFRKIVL
jgi:phosphoribosyl-ATP pyrophosphohydrolase/phosphoribosyl-AMP cyclohydrolase